MPSPNGTHADVLDVTEVGTEGVTLDKPGDTATVTPEPQPHRPGDGDGDTEAVTLAKPAPAPAPEGPRGPHGPGGLPPLAGGPLIPPWMRDLRSSGEWALRYVLHLVVFHGIRLPVYLARACAYTPRGIVRAAASLGRWATDAESRPLRQAANDARLFTEYDRLDKARKEKAKSRVPVACIVAFLVVALVAGGLMAESLWLKALTVLSVVVVAGWHGRSPDRPLVESAVVTTPKARRLTADTVTNAFVAGRLAKLPDHPVTFWSKVARDGDGWSAVVDLPIGYGKTADDAIAARKRIATALVVDEGRLFLSRARGDGGSAGRVNFYLADTDPMAGTAPKSPLVKVAEVDLWRPVPFGVDERGRPVSVSMLWTSFGFAGVPGAGKTASIRNPACAAALDPFADLGVFDGKGESGLSVDWDAFREVCEAYGAGDDEDTARHLLAYLERLVVEMNRRSGVIARLPRAQRRDGKLTRQLARQAKNMRLKVVIIDEAQDFIGDFVTHEYRDLIRAALAKLIKRGRFVGIIVILATQRVDAKAIPTTLRDNLGSKFGLRVTTTFANEVALGAGAKEQGFDSTALLPHHLGVGWLVGSAVPKEYASGGVLVWSNYIDLEDAEKICARGRALREQHGTLIGEAAGETHDDSTVSLLSDIAAVWPPGAQNQWNEELVAALDERFGDRYVFDAQSFGTAAKAIGLETRQINRKTADGKATNRKGLTWARVSDALERRNQRRLIDTPGDVSDDEGQDPEAS
jgi:S-DNA-T family DNA segregation ATPase FtsK/SpoIIIE